MKCPACDFELPDGFKFCGSCGHKLDVAPQLEAERRQLTVLFCDLVGSTDLSAAIDAEELRELVRAYQAICAEVLEKKFGHVAQYLGDGILAYFGYPVAHESSASNAVESALEIHSRVAEWNRSIPHDIQLRTGIHTGTVVIGEVGAGAHRENLALGETPNLAARLQGVAQPGEVVVSEETYHLVRHRVQGQSLGKHSLKGLPEPIEVFLAQASSDRKTQRHIERIRRSRLPLLGREQEKLQLWKAWHETRSGKGAAVAISGDAGMGKSRLNQWLKDRVFLEKAYLVSLYPSPETTATPLACVLERMQLELPTHQSLQEKWPDFANLDLVQELLGYQESPPIPGRQKQRVQAVVSLWEHMALKRPLLVACDGAEHLDSQSRELLEHLAQRCCEHPIMFVSTWRKLPPGEWGENIALTGLKQEYLLTLIRLTSPHPLSSAEVRKLAARTEGNPLFAEELARTAESERASRLKDLFAAKLDRLGETKPRVQRLAAVGRRFSRSLVEALGRTVDEPLGEVLDHCLDEQVLEQEHPDLAFRQRLFHESVYQGLLTKSRQKFHSDVVSAIRLHLPELEQSQPEVVAHHLLRSAHPEQAIPALVKAGEKALYLSANQEAVIHFGKALELLPEGLETAPQRIQFLLARGSALTALRGYAHPEVKEAFQSARALCAALGDPEPTFPALCGLWAFWFVSGELEQATQISERLMQLSENGDSARQLVAHATLGQTKFLCGDFETARTHLLAVRELHDPEYHDSIAFSCLTTDPAVASLSYLSWIEQATGDREKASELADQAMAMARRLNIPHTLTHTYFYDMWMAYERGDEPRLQQSLGDLAQSADTYDFTLWLALAGVFEALISRDLAAYGTALEALGQTGTKMGETWFMLRLAQLLKEAGQSEQAFGVLSQALAIAQGRGERFYLPQLERFKSSLQQLS